MGKNNTAKKGKQKEPIAPSAPPPPPVPSPPSAHHIEQPFATIHTIEEEEELGGPPGRSHSRGPPPSKLMIGISGDPVEGTEEESWQNVSRSVDGWGADESGNSNGDDGWGPSAAQASMPQSPRKKIGRKDHTKSHHPQQKLLPPPPAHQNPQDIWIPEEEEWAEDDECDEQEDGDGWGHNDGWNNDNGDWDQQQPHSATWAHAISAPSVRSQVPSHAPTTGWQSWGEEARRLPKVTFDPAIPPSPSSTRSKPAISQLQRSQILSSLLNNPRQTQQPYPMAPAARAPPAANSWQQHQFAHHENRHQQQQPEPHRSREQSHGHGSKRNVRTSPQRAHPQPQGKSGRQRQEEQHDAWGLGDGWSDLSDEEEQQDMEQDAWGRKVHFSPGPLRASMLPSAASAAPSAVVENFTVNALPHNKLGLSTIPMSKTLSYAYSGTTPSTESEPGRAAMQRITDFQFFESRGEALKGVEQALYGKQRKATDRFHWLFSPDKDERVSSLLKWINSMSFGIASFGLQKFLQTRERGALIVNAGFRPVHSPSEPAFDWITWGQIQRTMDRILQESVGYYNPAMHIIVFVVLPSLSGNSVAIWRRKLPIPNNIRLAYQAQITQAMASLRKEYPVLVDELPSPTEPTPPPPSKKKRKWYKLWLSS